MSHDIGNVSSQKIYLLFEAYHLLVHVYRDANKLCFERKRGGLLIFYVAGGAGYAKSYSSKFRWGEITSLFLLRHVCQENQGN